MKAAEAAREKLGRIFSALGKSGKADGKASNRTEPGGLGALYRKELADHLNSPRFLIIFALLAVTSIASLYGALSVIHDAAAEDSKFLFLMLFTLSGNSIPAFASFIAFLGPLAGLILGSLNRLVSQPIYRDSVINGKFLAGFAVILMTVFSLGLLICGVGIISIGIPPRGEEVARIFVFLLFTVFYFAFWLGLAILFSVLCRHAATSALSGICVWVFLSFFMSMIAGIIADSIYPTGGIEGVLNIYNNYAVKIGLQRISPYYLFSEAAITILNPNVRTIGLVTPAQLSGAIAGYLPFSQSLLLIWPHLVCMVALTIICFAVSYVLFMRQEVRA
jgi:ABC-2 type transport system permease protein